MEVFIRGQPGARGRPSKCQACKGHQIYLMISCSRSSSCFCRTMTDSMMARSSGVRWDRSGPSSILAPSGHNHWTTIPWRRRGRAAASRCPSRLRQFCTRMQQHAAVYRRLPLLAMSTTDGTRRGRVLGAPTDRTNFALVSSRYFSIVSAVVRPNITVCNYPFMYL